MRVPKKPEARNPNQPSQSLGKVLPVFLNDNDSDEKIAYYQKLLASQEYLQIKQELRDIHIDVSSSDEAEDDDNEINDRNDKNNKNNKNNKSNKNKKKHHNEDSDTDDDDESGNNSGNSVIEISDSEGEDTEPIQSFMAKTQAELNDNNETMKTKDGKVKYRPGVKALKEIRYFQKYAKNIIPYQSFRRVCVGCVKEIKQDYTMSAEAVLALRVSFNFFLFQLDY
jgi:cobalamin biosynthesis protein CobT